MDTLRVTNKVYRGWRVQAGDIPSRPCQIRAAMSVPCCYHLDLTYGIWSVDERKGRFELRSEDREHTGREHIDQMRVSGARLNEQILRSILQIADIVVRTISKDALIGHAIFKCEPWRNARSRESRRAFQDEVVSRGRWRRCYDGGVCRISLSLCWVSESPTSSERLLLHVYSHGWGTSIESPHNTILTDESADKQAAIDHILDGGPAPTLGLVRVVLDSTGAPSHTGDAAGEGSAPVLRRGMRGAHDPSPQHMIVDLLHRLIEAGND